VALPFVEKKEVTRESLKEQLLDKVLLRDNTK